MSNSISISVSPDAKAESLGRNGWSKTHGLEVYLSSFGDNLVKIDPVTSRGYTQACQIQITPEAMTELAMWWLNLQAQNQSA
jgi:hypothetical protein